MTEVEIDVRFRVFLLRCCDSELEWTEFNLPKFCPKCGDKLYFGGNKSNAKTSSDDSGVVYFKDKN